MDNVNDNDFKSQRISLIILSIAIIMYVTGGGSVGTEGAIFGGTVHFKNTDVITYTGLGLYLWFNWMLILNVKDNSNEFLLNFKYYLYSSDEYKKIATEFLNYIISNNKANIGLPQRNLETSVMYNHNRDANQRAEHLPPLLTNLFQPDTLFYNINSHQIGDWDKSNPEPWKRIKAYPIPHHQKNLVIKKNTPLLKMYWLELRCLYKVMLFHKQYPYVIAPFLLSGIAASLLILDFGMSGFLSIFYGLKIFFTEYYKQLLLAVSIIFIMKVS